MPSALRARVALVGLLAVLLIPIGTSSLRGLTHILTCREEAGTPFAIEVPDEGAPVISSSAVLERDAAGDPPTRELCGGLRLDLAIGSRSGERAEVQVTIGNATSYGWRGSVQLQLDATTIPIDIGEIAAHGEASDTVELRLRSGRSYEVRGNLLVGP